MIPCLCFCFVVLEYVKECTKECIISNVIFSGRHGMRNMQLCHVSSLVTLLPGNGTVIGLVSYSALAFQDSDDMYRVWNQQVL